MKRNGFVLMLAIFMLGACKVQPEDIDYGNEACVYCQMNIVDTRYAAEIVTEKGKVYKYDAVECMINYVNKNEINKEDIAYTLVNTYTEPKKLYDARKSFYLRTMELPSPMGMYITAFNNKDSANHYMEKHDGKIFTWDALNDQFEGLPNLAE